MRMYTRFIVGTFVVAWSAAPLNLGTAAAQGENLRDAFDDASLPGWERSPNVAVVDGALQIPPGGFAARFGSWPEPTLTIQVKIAVGGQAAIGYSFRDSGHYRLAVSPDELVLERVQETSGRTLGRALPSGLLPDTWVELQVSHTHGEHRVSLDGVELLSAAEDEPLPPGGIILWAEGEAPALFDDLEIEAFGAAQPTPAVAETAPATTSPSATAPAGGLAALLDQFSTRQTDPLQLSAFAVNLGLAALFAFLLGQAYVAWGTSLSNRRAFAANFVLITVTTTFIILVVRSSVALSLGLVGALSIVRFRAAIKEPEELAYLFFAVGLGIGLGDNQRLLTTMALIAGLILIGLLRLFRRSQTDVNLHLTLAGEASNRVELESLVATLKRHCTKLKLLRFDESASRQECSFLVELKTLDDLQAARDGLRALAPGLEITFLDNRGIW